jgi:hypothetical protein
LEAAFADASRPVQVVASAGLWLGWLAGLVATLVPRTISLTVLRTLAPAAVVAVGLAAVQDSESAVWRAVGLVSVLVAAALAFSPVVGRIMVDGSSYGDEQRFPLRVPAPLLAGPVPLAWAGVAVGVTAGPLLLAAKNWVGGGVAVLVGATAAWWGARALHVLARRWIVLVPAGLVIHDQLALADPILLRREQIRSLDPAPADTDALDLTRGALGLALELSLVGPVALTTVAERPGAAVEATKADHVLFTPTQPGALLTACRARRIGRAH